MLRLKREDIIKRFSIGSDIYGKSLFKLNNKEYDMDGVLFIGNKAIYTNNSFLLFAKTLDMPDIEEMEYATMWKYNTPEEENPIVDVREDINDIQVQDVPKKEKLTSLLSATKDNQLTDEEVDLLQNVWEREVVRSFTTLTSIKIIFRKNDLLSEIQKLYGREKKSKGLEALAIRIDRESGLLRMTPFRYKKKDIKREEKIMATIPGGELLVPFFEDNFLGTQLDFDNKEKGMILRVQELELIDVFQENEYISLSANPLSFDPNKRNKQKEYTTRGMHRVFFKGYGEEDSSIRLQLPQVVPNYNPLD